MVNIYCDYTLKFIIGVIVMDSGSRIGRAGIKLCTNSFTYRDCIRLTKVLHDLYNLKSSVQSAGRPGKYIIYVWAESMSDLRSVVRPHMVSSILYKLAPLPQKPERCLRPIKTHRT